MTSAHIAIVLYGSRGDIQPGICLALELQVRGHRVSALVPPNLAGLARATGVRDVHEIGLDSDTAWSSEDARSATSSGTGSDASLRKRYSPALKASKALS